MTDTPETNAAEFPCMTWPSQDHPMVVRSEVAERLERERDEAREQLTAVTAQLDMLAVVFAKHTLWLRRSSSRSHL